MTDASDGFRREVRDQLRTVSNGLIDIEGESDPDPDTVDEVFRAAHSLKGNCSMVDLQGASDLAHAIEDALDGVRKGELAPSERVIDDALTGVDEIEAAVDAFEANEPVPDSDAALSRLRGTIAAERESPATGDGVERTEADESSATGSEESVGELLDSGATESEDLSVEEALDRASEFEDLDALAEELDDDEVGDFDSWGTFDDPNGGKLGDERSVGPDGADESPTPAPDEKESGGATGESDEDSSRSDGMERFEAVKAETDVDPLEEDLTTLESDIEAAEFGEFDDEDELSIEELLDADPAGDVDSETEDIGAGEVAAEDEEGEAATFEEIADEVEPDQDLDALEADIEATEFGEFDDEDEFTIPELLEAGPSELDEEYALDDGGPTSRAAETEEDDVSEPVADAEDSDVRSDEAIGDDAEAEADASDVTIREKTPTTPESGLGPDSDTSSAESVPTEGSDASDIADDSDPFISPNLVDAAADEPTASASESDASEPPNPPETDASSSDRPEDEGRERFDAAERTNETSESDSRGADVGGEAAGDESERDLDTAMDDLDELVSASSIDDATDDASDTDATFARDADVEAFEEQFGELFDDASEEESPSVPAATTLEESSLSVTTDDETESDRDVAESQQTGSVTVDVGVADALLHSVEELSRNHLRLERALREDDGPSPEEVLRELRTVTAGLRDSVLDVRLMSISSVTDDLPRVVRAAARETEKEVSFEVEGGDITLDKAIIDRLHDPLSHLLRNAVAHGIEPPAEREATGKPREGTVGVRARRRRDRVVVEVYDDGRGLEPERIRRTAVEQGVVTDSEAEELSMDEVYDLIFRPGFSTAESVTEVSGRGVGLDVVDRAVTELNGTVGVETDPGEGTTVRLSLPVSVAVAEVLFVHVGDEEYAIRTSAIEHIGRPTAVETVDGREMVTLESAVGDADPTSVSSNSTPGGTPPEDDDSVEEGEEPEAPEHSPLLRLAEAFDVEGAGGDEGVVVQLRDELRELALYCDEFGETREVIVDPYTGVLNGVPGVSGATTLGEGDLVNVIDVHTL